jgi:hypothetical protein
MAKKKDKSDLILMEIPAYPKVIESFRSVGDYELNNMRHSEPSCFNGIVSVRRYRITVEEIEEPKQVIAERLEKLWVESDNHHHWQPLQNAAARIGYTFKGECGSKKKAKTY